MKRIFVDIAKACFNLEYKIMCRVQTRKSCEVLFVSRQADQPPRNFRALGAAFEHQGWTSMYHVKRLSKKTVLPYAAHVVREIALLARCQVCVLDRYDPVVGLLDFECEPVASCVEEGVIHNEFPSRPVVLQLWHAFGAFKKFGYQSLDTVEGHSRRTALMFGIHRNYSWVICTSEQNRRAYAEAFACPLARVVPLGLPEYDELVLARAANKEQSSPAHFSDVPRVLFAPTLRKSEHSVHPFRELRKRWDRVRCDVPVVWSFHPIETGCGAAGGVPPALLESDYIVTDYSSIVYEAYLLGKRVLFYVPDIEEYRVSPGLNADPALLAPEITFLDEAALIRYLERLAVGDADYPQAAFDRFIGKTFAGCSEGTALRIVEFVVGCVPREADTSGSSDCDGTDSKQSTL